jgi:hypothetical protein
MRKVLTISLLVAGLSHSFAGTFGAEEARMVELAAPRDVGQGEAVQLQITAGPLTRGARLTIATEQGKLLGAVAPFGQELGRSSSTTATVPVPRSAIEEGRVRLRLQVLEPGSHPRPPRPEEVQRLDLVLVPHAD